jgi:hypothetical protein
VEGRNLAEPGRCTGLGWRWSLNASAKWLAAWRTEPATCASAADLCRHVTFSKPRIAIEDVDHMAEGETLVSPALTKKSTVTSAVLLPIPLHWAPLFLTKEEPINAKDAFVASPNLPQASTGTRQPTQL